MFTRPAALPSNNDNKATQLFILFKCDNHVCFKSNLAKINGFQRYMFVNSFSLVCIATLQLITRESRSGELNTQMKLPNQDSQNKELYVITKF